MAVIDIRRRTGYLFLAVVVAHVILISTQVTTRRGVPMLQEAVFGVFSEVQRVANAVTTTVQSSWQNYFALQQVQEENDRLKQQISALQIRLQQERNLAQQSESLQKLLELKTATQLMTTAASVIAGSASPEFRTITVDKGTSKGVHADMAVISPAGIVGRIIQPSARASKVQLLIDRNAAAGALVERTRAQGVVVGTGTDDLRMDYVSGSADVKPGDSVVTSGIDGIYPKGFVIGQIQSVRRGAGQYSSIVIRPAVDFSALEAVLIVLTPPSAAEAAGVVIAIALALALQTSLARLLVGGTAALDLVLVVVVYVALTSGPVTGMLSGSVAGIVQDALSSGTVGIGGLAKAIVGFGAGVIGQQFIVTAAFPRFVMFIVATLVHSALFMGMYMLLGLKEFPSPWAAVLSQAIGNAVVGIVAFAVVESLPGAIERRRFKRSSR